MTCLGISARRGRVFLATMVALLVLSGISPVSAQTSRSGASRLELQTTIDLAAAGSLRLTRTEFDEIQRRLQHGDFSVGDQISLQVTNEPTLTGQFTINPGPSLALPDISDISLFGVLRSELTDHLTTELSRYLRNPQVEATTLIRISVFGEVGSPGFYHMSPNLTLSDAIMSAGGMTSNSDMGKVVIRRGDTEIVDRDRSTAAITEGTTLDRMNLHGGDAIDVGSSSSSLIGNIGRGLLVVGALAASILSIERLLR